MWQGVNHGKSYVIISLIWGERKKKKIKIIYLLKEMETKFDIRKILIIVKLLGDFR